MSDDYEEEEYDEEEYYEETPDLSDIEEEEYLTERERRENRILKIHPFLVRRPVKIVSTKYTRQKGWNDKAITKLVGKTGVVTEVHSNVIEAVRVQIDGSEINEYWHHQDLQLQNIKEETIEPIFFNPMDLVI